MTAVAPLPFTARFPLFMRLAAILVWPVGFAATFGGIRLAVTDGGIDAHAYWVAGRVLSYGLPAGQRDAFLYSPLFADAVHPLALLPWPVFWAVWTVLEVAVLVWLVRPLPVRWAVPAALLAVPELANGNIYLFLAAAAVVGMRFPTVWLFPVLTKVTTGVGLVWFAARGEWRRLAAPAVALAVLVGGSYLLQPGAWQAWIGLLLQPGGTRDGLAGFLVRCVTGIVVTVVAARKGWAWLIPVAMVIVAPVSAVTTLTMLVAVPRLSRSSAPRRSRSTVSPASPPMPSRSTP